MEYKHDTIAAISTASGKAGIAVIRMSGKDAYVTVDKYFKGKKKVSEQKHNTIQFGKIVCNNKLIDEVLISKFCAPQSYTGEDVVEISCHGNDFIARMILEILLHDVRLAEPGEFTYRSFINNKMDLTQAEAVGDLLEAKTKHQHQMAVSQLEGKLNIRISKILDEITELRTLLELEIDFQEQGLTDLDSTKFIQKLDSIIQTLQEMLSKSNDGIILREGLRVSLIGKPNVGKSSIFNKLLESERAIVTPIPGTTRDYIEEAISLDGFLIRFFDTAGLRKTYDQVEKIGIDRALEVIKNSHLILNIQDAEDKQTDFTIDVNSDKFINVLNKSDIYDDNILQSFRERNFVIASTFDDNGLDELKKRIISEIDITQNDIESGLLANIRQIDAVKKTIQALEKAKDSFRDEIGIEFTAFDLQEASHFLETIIGKVTDEDIRSKIFNEFCVGK